MDLATEYFYAAEEIKAEELLSGFEVSAYPHTKSKEREKRHKELTQIAYPNHVRKGKRVSFEELKRVLQNGK